MLRKSKVYRWLVWSTLLLPYLISFFHRYSLGIIKDDLSATYGMSAVTFANLSSMYFYAYMFMQIPTGLLADTLGTRLTVSAGMLIAAAGSLLFGLSPVMHLVFIGRFFIGIGVSVVFVCIMKFLSKWYNEKEFATMSGLTTFIANAGATLTQSPLAIIISILGWRYTFGAVGVISLLIAALCLAVVRNAPEAANASGSRKPVEQKPMEQIPAKQEPKEQEPVIREPVVQEPVAQEPAKTGADEKRSIIKAMIAVLKNIRTWPVFLMYAGFYGTSQAFDGIWSQSYVMDVYGLNKIDAAGKTLYIFVGGAIGCFVIGILSDRLKKRKLPLLAFGGINLLCWVFLIFINHGKPPVEILEILLFTLGFSGKVIILSWACGKEVNDPIYAGISTSVINIGGFVGAALVPVIIGNIIDKYKGIMDMQQLYVKSFLFCFLSVAFGFICIFFIKETGCRNISSYLGKQAKTNGKRIHG